MIYFSLTGKIALITMSSRAGHRGAYFHKSGQAGNHSDDVRILPKEKFR